MQLRRATLVAVVLSAGFLTACSYSYDDGLPPLGNRITPSSSPTPNPLLSRQRDLLQPSHGTTEAPTEDWTPQMVSSWASQTLPDSKGMTFGFGYGVTRPDQPVLAETALPTGTFTLQYACRGPDTAHLTLTIAGSAIVDSDYACGRVWVRAVVAAKDSVAEVRASTTTGVPAAYAFRIVRP